MTHDVSTRINIDVPRNHQAVMGLATDSPSSSAKFIVADSAQWSSIASHIRCPKLIHFTRRSVKGRKDEHTWDTKSREHPPSSRINMKKLFLRLVSGILMMLMLTMIRPLGPLFLIIAIACIQLMVFKEVVSIAYSKSKEKKLPWFRTTMW